MTEPDNDNDSYQIEIVRLRPAAGRRADLVELLMTRGASTLRPPEVETLDVAEDRTSAHVIVVLRWRSAGDHNRRVADADVGALFDEIAALSDGPPTLELFEGVGPT